MSDYPRLPEGENWLAEKLVAASVSYEHAVAIIEAFTGGRCPQPSDIARVGFDLRDKFLPPKPKEVLTMEPDPEWSRELVENLGSGNRDWQEEMLDRCIVDAVKRGEPTPGYLAWAKQNFPEKLTAARAGEPLPRRKSARRVVKSSVSANFQPITEADIRRAEAELHVKQAEDGAKEELVTDEWQEGRE